MTDALEVAAQLKSSFLGFKANVAKIATLSVDQPPPSPLDLSSLSREDEQVEKVMSKSQCGLTVNESTFWKGCITKLTRDTSALGESAEITESPRDQLESLVDKSSVMVSMYERRTNVPTRETYKQSRQILEALGIPCIEVTDGFEAEALASSMVLGGLADYVVSEDTVRLPSFFPSFTNGV
jgi:flap endonuclease-1